METGKQQAEVKECVRVEQETVVALSLEATSGDQ